MLCVQTAYMVNVLTIFFFKLLKVNNEVNKLTDSTYKFLWLVSERLEKESEGFHLEIFRKLKQKPQQPIKGLATE